MPKISSYEAAAGLNNEDLFVIVQGGVTKKITHELIKAASGIYSGTGTFNGSAGVTINIGATLAGTVYAVAITVTSANPVNVGEISVEDKANNQFVVKNTGSDTTSTFDWILKDNN